jgi:orotidine-5'-phosphate decarboxylase
MKNITLLRAPKKKNSPKLIVALDVDTLKKAKSLVDRLYPAVKIFKIGSQLFTKEGPEAVRMVRKKGAQVFLDLKFHDIPNTVAQAVESARGHGVFILNIHASGGSEMMKAAVLARGKNKKPFLLAVTMLTSMDKRELVNIGIPGTPLVQVKKLAMLAKKCGMDGVVCSGHEIDLVRRSCGRDFIVLTPGIRPPGCSVQDQKRTMTPDVAAKKGADYIVVGRPVTQAKDPLESAKNIIASFKRGNACSKDAIKLDKH